MLVRAWQRTCKLRPRRVKLLHTRAPVIDELKSRGLLADATKVNDLSKSLEKSPQVIYSGIDPTADTLHAGHLLPLMCLLHFQLRGHRIIPLIGGATGLIGDPSGRNSERALAVKQEVEDNVQSLASGVNKFFASAKTFASKRGYDVENWRPIEVKNNLDWYSGVSMLDFLRDVGVHARVNAMINRESVQARLNSQQGISFTEFTYQLLQAYDFYHLYQNEQCTLQIGGSDQWGNIVAGLDMIQKLRPPVKEETTKAPEAFGLTTPLLTTASGQKFGKSAGNAIWLDPSKTPAYDLFQFFYRTADADVEKYLRFFTLHPPGRIEYIMTEHKTQPELRRAQSILALEVTELVHGINGVSNALNISKLLYSDKRRTLRCEEVLDAMKGDPRLYMVDRMEFTQKTVVKLATEYGLFESGSKARAVCSAKGLYLNNTLWDDPRSKMGLSELIDDRLVVLRAGKNKHIVLVARE